MPTLDPSRCKLLRDDRLVDRYNAVHDVLEEAARELPRFGERAVVAEARSDLDRLAETMTKERFQIGFIGPSQIGKSATVRNLLRVSSEDAPTPEGSGGPTTSVPTRTIPRPPGSTTQHKVWLHYYSKAEFTKRVADICDLVKIRFDEDLRQVREAAAAKQREDPHYKAADIEVLLKLLDAAINFDGMLKEPGEVQEGIWSDRRLYVTHQNTPSQYTLLREVRYEFVTDAISPEVEIIDLPGIDVDKGSDARLTLAFVPQLDGAFMVQSAQQVKSGSVAQLAERMREIHGKTLGERVWMVVTLCDKLNDLQINGPRDRDDQPTMFCHLAELMQQQGIKANNVFFVGNGYYWDRAAAGLGETERPTDALVARHAPGVQFHADGTPVIPERCSRNGGQIESWRRYVLDGGIPGLRETMQTTLADAVREQGRRDVSQRLVGIIDRLAAALQAAEQQSGMTAEEMMRAARWSGELDRLSDEIGRDPRYSHASAAAIEQKLRDLIEGWGGAARDGLAEAHRQLAGMLAHVGLDEALKQTTLVTDLVKARLEEQVRIQPPPHATGLPTPLEHWATCVASHIDLGRTFDGRDFRGPIFAGFNDDPTPLADRGQNMSAADYPVVMRFKAARVARVYGSRLVHEIQSHLRRLQGRYRAVGTEITHIDSGHRERYAKFRADLDRLRN